ncbi:protein FAM131A isoform X2 [Sardina pilchardus]|uniref:protein FAM131A isoform X2 n=1 Tax=Sardina pilchardus TaxID=27697 RepID=UPI002E166B9E
MLYPCAMLLTALPQLNIKVEDPADMLPKSRKALSIQEIAALARSSFNGISQVVKDHVTKPTAMAQGRVAHLIEWKGWSKPLDPPTATLQSHFSSYCHLTEGEQEARFAAGVAEQFAIAEAKLRAWTSVDEEDGIEEEAEEEDADSCDEDNSKNNDVSLMTETTDPTTSNPLSQTLCLAETDSSEAQPLSDSSPNSVVQGDLLKSRPPPHSERQEALRSSTQPTYLGEEEEEEEEEEENEGEEEEEEGKEEQLRGLNSGSTCDSGPHRPSRRSLWSGGDSCYYSLNSYSESGLSPEEEEEEEEEEAGGHEREDEGEDSVFREAVHCYSHCRSMSDTSGVASFEEEEAVEERERMRL